MDVYIKSLIGCFELSLEKYVLNLVYKEFTSDFKKKTKLLLNILNCVNAIA